MDYVERRVNEPEPRSRAALERFVREALRRSAGADLVVVDLPAPDCQPDALLRALELPDAFLYRSAGAGHWSGIGTALRFEGSGARRIARIREAAGRLKASRHTWPGLSAPPLRLHGGMAFASAERDERSTDAWRGFGNAAFGLPRWGLRREGGERVLTLALDPAAGEPVDGVLAELGRVLEALARSGASDPAGSGPAPAHILDVRDLPFEVWEHHIERIRSEIRAGRFVKVVAARETEVRADRPFDDLAVFRTLERDHPHCNLFLFRRGSHTFLGASPEQLVSKRDTSCRTHALAGSMRAPLDGDGGTRGGAPLGEALLASSKDRWEHEVVVREIVARLEPLSARVEHPPSPEIVRVRDILHLNSPIRAELHPTTHVLDLLEALHPTPSVGGVPRADAMDWIEANEPMQRGWYTGPIGWFDATGDGEFVVAIRCGLLAGDRALLQAGAGIVEASDPRAEYEETALKQRPMRRALGLAS